MAMGKSEIVSKIMDRIFPRGKSLHVLQCPIETSRTQWESAINELEEILIELRTNPQIIMAWKLRLLSWQDQQQFPFRLFTLGMKVYSAL